jgi:hypothetical protein
VAKTQPGSDHGTNMKQARTAAVVDKVLGFKGKKLLADDEYEDL